MATSVAIATNDVRTVALVTQSAAIVTGWADTLVVAGVSATPTRRSVVAASTALRTQLVAHARVLLNVVADVKIWPHTYMYLMQN